MFPSLIVLLFFAGCNGDSYKKKVLTVLFGLYDGRNVTIIVNVIKIKMDKTDIIKFGRWKNKF